jgi:hypothetical protein
MPTHNVQNIFMKKILPLLIGICLSSSVAHAALSCTVDTSNFRWAMMKVGTTFTLSIEGFRQVGTNYVAKNMFNGESYDGAMSINSDTGRFTFSDGADLNFLANNRAGSNRPPSQNAEGRCRPQ